MLSHPIMNTNGNECIIRGGFGLSAGAALTTSVVGDLVPLTGAITKTGTGTYRVRITAARICHHRVIDASSITEAVASFYGSAPATVTGVRVLLVSSEASTGDLLIDIVTHNAAFAATDTTAATEVRFTVAFKTSPRY